MLTMTKKINLVLILLLVSVGVHFAFFGHPNETVFDEVHFGKFVSAYYTHEYYFDIHPPGGKLIIAGFAKLFNFSPEYSFAKIGQPFPDNKYLFLRFLPALAGTLLPIVIFLLACSLGIKQNASFLAGMFVALENAILTQSRYILLDPFLLLFGFTALLLYFYSKSEPSSKKRIGLLVLMSIFAGLSMSIKWTGLSFLAVIGIAELVSIIRSRSWLEIKKLFIFFFAIPLSVYFLIFLIHFSLLTKSGDGDAFMTPDFQSSLDGSVYANNPQLQRLNTFQKFTELNTRMYTANQGLTATHPYSSKWYTWPFMTRPIYYWNSSSFDNGHTERIYLLGNPFIWYLSTIALFYSILSFFGNKLSRDKILYILLGGFAINLLPFIGIGRVMFIYHYLTAYIFAIIMIAYWIAKFKPTNENKQVKIILGLILLAGIFFLYFSPLSYGLDITQSEFMNRMWLTSWQ
jgi:dolichyl-phosphate-mannose-protein mannosyltransferase